MQQVTSQRAFQEQDGLGVTQPPSKRNHRGKYASKAWYGSQPLPIKPAIDLARQWTMPKAKNQSKHQYSLEKLS